MTKVVPAGVSRTSGKPYPAFETCSNRQCGWKPPQAQQQRIQPQQRMQPQAEPMKKEMLISYEKDLMVAAVEVMKAEMAAGIHPTDRIKRVQEIYSVLIGEFRLKVVGKYFPKPTPPPEPEPTEPDYGEIQDSEVPF